MKLQFWLEGLLAIQQPAVISLPLLLALWFQDEIPRSSTGLKADTDAEKQERGFKEKDYTSCCLVTKCCTAVSAPWPPLLNKQVLPKSLNVTDWTNTALVSSAECAALATGCKRICVPETNAASSAHQNALPHDEVTTNHEQLRTEQLHSTTRTGWRDFSPAKVHIRTAQPGTIGCWQSTNNVIWYFTCIEHFDKHDLTWSSQQNPELSFSKFQMTPVKTWSSERWSNSLKAVVVSTWATRQQLDPPPASGKALPGQCPTPSVKASDWERHCAMLTDNWYKIFPESSRAPLSLSAKACRRPRRAPSPRKPVT